MNGKIQGLASKIDGQVLKLGELPEEIAAQSFKLVAALEGQFMKLEELVAKIDGRNQKLLFPFLGISVAVAGVSIVLLRWLER